MSTPRANRLCRTTAELWIRIRMKPTILAGSRNGIMKLFACYGYGYRAKNRFLILRTFQVTNINKSLTWWIFFWFQKICYNLSGYRIWTRNFLEGSFIPYGTYPLHVSVHQNQELNKFYHAISTKTSDVKIFFKVQNLVRLPVLLLIINSGCDGVSGD
jgi:hypothetical protein